MVQNDDIPVFLQGVRSCHFPDITAQYVHPICSQNALRLRHVCSHPSGLSGGKQRGGGPNVRENNE